MNVSKMASEKMLHLLVIHVQVIHSFYEVLLKMAFSQKQITVLFCLLLLFWYLTFK